MNRALNIALAILVVLTPVAVSYGYDKWTKIEDARRGQ